MAFSSDIVLLHLSLSLSLSLALAFSLSISLSLFLVAKTKRMSVTPTTAAGASGYPPPATEPSAQGAMQHLKALNFLFLKETKDLREKIGQLRSELAAVSSDRCIDEGIQRDVCGVVVSSHLASTVEGCTALLRKADSDLASEKAATAETTASLLKKADASAAELCQTFTNDVS